MELKKVYPQRWMGWMVRIQLPHGEEIRDIGGPILYQANIFLAYLQEVLTA
jgi:hypothetical protein